MRSMAVLTIVVLFAGVSAAGESGAGSHLVLDLDRGSFRAFLRWRTPVLVTKDGKTKPLLQLKRRGQKEEDRQPVPAARAAPPPKDWAGLKFDDGRWPRARGPVCVNLWYGRAGIYQPGNPSEWSLICLRGGFKVTDPAAVQGLKLELRYYGGAVVYVNGQELARSHLPEGKIDFGTPAEMYGDPAYLRPDGKQYGLREEKQFPERVKTRTRGLKSKDGAEGVSIPAKMLRKGINVIAVEAHAALLREVAVKAKYGKVNWRGKPTPWPHCGVVSARLSAASGAGLATRAGPSPGIKLYNCQPIESVEVWDYAHPAENIRPIRMIGARNGTFSGKVVLSSAGSIRNLKATVSDLALPGGKGKIAAAAVKVRCAEPSTQPLSWNVAQRFDRLADKMPAEIKPLKISIRRRKVQPEPAAVVPVWISVRVPADAEPGEYKGTLKIEAQGARAEKFSVPVELAVHDWKVPDPKDWVMRYNIYQSPETVARHYKVDFWSDKHFELIGKSFEVLHAVGSKICVLDLVVDSPSLGNSQSMVRWIKQSDGSYKHDFTVVDKYLDVYEKKCGKPAIVLLNAWSHYKLKDKAKVKPKEVTVYDPATKTTSNMPQPAYGTPESEKFWKPVFAGLRKRLEKRKWQDVAAVCYLSYCWAPPAELVDVYQKIWPDGRWFNCSHSNPRAWKGSQGSMPVPYSEWVWGCGRLYNPEAKGRYKLYPRPWKLGKGRIEVGNPRYGVGFIMVLRDYSPLAAYRFVAESALQANVRGLGRVGGDFWPLLMGEKRKRWKPMCTSAAAVGPVNNTKAMLSPGPAGAVFNERLEMFREGVQITEAIAFLQKACEEKKAGAELAARVAKLLDERARYYVRTRRGQSGNWWSLESSAWQERDDALYALAAEVARAAGGK